MFRINQFSYKIGNENRVLNFSSKHKGGNLPFISLIIGPNGTGKSIILNKLSKVFLQYANINVQDKVKDFSIKYVHGDDVIDSTKDIKKFPLPNKLIVCSFLITDKFIYDDNKTNFYQYHGIRSTKTGVGTRTHIKKLADLIINNSDENIFIQKLGKILDFIDLKKSIEISFNLKNKNYFFLQGEPVTKDFLEDYFKKWKKYFPKRKTEPFSYNKFIQFEEDNLIDEIVSTINNLANKQKKNKVTYTINFDSTSKNKEFLNEYRIIKLLMELDLISSPDLIIVKKDDFSLEFASYGELHILYTFLSILSSIEDNSLILLDEPEISLHPNWQIRYIKLLEEIFCDYSTCHFIIATHSHFMVSDLKSDNSSIIALRYDKNNKDIKIERIEQDTFALSAENILYSIFQTRTVNNYYLDKDLSEILSLIMEKNTDIKKVKDLYNNIKLVKLDERDPMNLVLKQVENFLEEKL